MKVTEFLNIKEDQPFWGIENYDPLDTQPEIMVKRGLSIYCIGHGAPIDPDTTEFCEYVKPLGEGKAKAIKQHKEDIETALLIDAKRSAGLLRPKS